MICIKIFVKIRFSHRLRQPVTVFKARIKKEVNKLSDMIKISDLNSQVYCENIKIIVKLNVHFAIFFIPANVTR